MSLAQEGAISIDTVCGSRLRLLSCKILYFTRLPVYLRQEIKFMEEGNMQSTVFNPVQLHLLQMFSRMNSEEELREVKQVLSEYYRKKVEKHANELWDKLNLTQEKLNDMASIHERLPYQ